ncbi:hypothetical protein C0992_002093, partial [Termitomyces sp. T32_za158]
MCKLFMTSTKPGDVPATTEDKGTEKVENAVDEFEDLGDDGDSGLQVGDARSFGFFREENEIKGNEKSIATDEEEDDEKGDENYDPAILLNVKKFNAPHAFATYLRF